MARPSPGDNDKIEDEPKKIEYLDLQSGQTMTLKLSQEELKRRWEKWLYG